MSKFDFFRSYAIFAYVMDFIKTEHKKILSKEQLNRINEIGDLPAHDMSCDEELKEFAKIVDTYCESNYHSHTFLEWLSGHKVFSSI